MSVRTKSVLPMIAGLVALGVATGALAQIVSDCAACSLTGAITPTGGGGAPNTYSITEDYGERSGANLFYSFSDFEVGSNDVASFEPDPAAPLGTQLVLARIRPVDGAGNPIPNTISGRVSLQTPGARLMLVNSAGTIVTDDARLDVAGGVTLTTADEVRFAEGAGLPDTVVLARSTDPIQLSSADPTAFGFYGDPGAIDVEVGFLELDPQQTLRLVGNTVDVRAISSLRRLRTFGGRIEIAAVPNDVTVPVDVAAIDPALFADADAARVSLSGGGGVLLTLEVGSSFAGGEAPGTIVIRGGRVELVETRLSAETRDVNGAPPGSGIDVAGGDVTLTRSSLQTFAQRSGAAADLRVGADRLVVDDSSEILSVTDEGAGGSITLEGRAPGTEATSIALEGRARVITTARGTGDGGDITLRAGAIRIAGLDTIAGTGTEATGAPAGGGGGVRVTADTLDVLDGAQLVANTAGDGHAGDLVVVAREAVRVAGRAAGRASSLASVSGTELPGGGLVGGLGDAGDVSIETPLLEVTNGAQIRAASGGDGDAGAITLAGVGGGGARVERLRVAGGAEGFSTISVRARDGAGGSLTIEADQVELIDGGRLTATTGGTANGGTIRVTTRSLVAGGRDPVDGNESGVFSETLLPAPGAGTGGTIEIVDAERVTLFDGASISAQSTTSEGDAGGIGFVGVSHIALAQGSGIRTNSDSTRGGDIDLGTSRTIVLESGSEITTDVRLGPDPGGDIDLVTGVLALDESRVVADANGGPGGNITITAALVTRAGLSPDATGSVSRIQASSDLAVDGVVTINTPEADLIGSLAPLAEDRLLDDPLRATICDRRDPDSRRSRLVVAPRAPGGPAPGAWLPSWTEVPTAAERAVDCG